MIFPTCPDTVPLTLSPWPTSDSQALPEAKTLYFLSPWKATQHHYCVISFALSAQPLSYLGLVWTKDTMLSYMVILIIVKIKVFFFSKRNCLLHQKTRSFQEASSANELRARDDRSIHTDTFLLPWEKREQQPAGCPHGFLGMNHRHEDTEQSSWGPEGCCEWGSQTWTGLLPAWFYSGGDLYLGFSCQKPQSHDMMMSLIPGDLGVKTEWFWLPSSPLSFLLCREGRVPESRNEVCTWLQNTAYGKSAWL